MFQKILIANRGEIACRIIKTARRMGIATVAVYSEADRDALHVAMADEAVCIGPPPAAQSYLDIDRIVKACLDTGAQAVHPGYGFLAENARFAEIARDHGLTFIGPAPEVITATPDRKRSIEIFGVIPRPAAAFSPFTITKSICRSSLKRRTLSFTAFRPGSPITSPRNKIRSMRSTWTTIAGLSAPL